MKKQIYILLAILAILYLASRFYNLLAFPVFADEAIYIRWSQISWLDPNHRFISLTDGKPPLHIWAMIPFWSLISDPVYAGRVVSIITGLFTMLGIFFLGKKLFDKETGIFASFLYIVQPYAVMYDRLALTDSMLTAFGVWTLYLTHRLFKTPKILTGIILGLLGAATMLTKPTGIIFLAYAPLFLLLVPVHNKSKPYFSYWFKKIKSMIIPSAIAAGIALGIYNLLRFSTAFYMIKLRSLDYTRPQEEILTKFTEYFIQTLVVILTWVASYLTWPVLVFITLFVLYKVVREIIITIQLHKHQKTKSEPSMLNAKNSKYDIAFTRDTSPKQTYLFSWSKHTWTIIMLFIIAIVPILSEATVGKIIFPRYTLFILPALLLLFSNAITILLKFFQGNRTVTFTISLLTVAVIFYWLRFSTLLLLNPAAAPLEYAERGQYIENWSAGYGIQDIATFLQSVAKDRQIVVGVEGYWVMESSLSIYLEGNVLKNVEFVGQPSTIGDLDPYLIKKSQEGIPTYLVVNSNRLINQDPLLREVGRTPRPVGRDGEQALVIYRVLEIKELPRSDE